MSFLESLAVAVFCVAFVFLVLAVLYMMVLIMSRILRLKSGRKETLQCIAAAQPPGVEDWDVEPVNVSSGELKLINVDEKTAAMIIAIVSDESGISLSELRFKTIKALD